MLIQSSGRRNHLAALLALAVGLGGVLSPALAQTVELNPGAAPGTGTTPPTDPSKQPEPPKAAEPVAPKLGPNGEPLVTNVFLDTDLRQALADVATQTGNVILTDESVQGQISLELKEVGLDEALELMLLPGGFVYEKIRDKIYLVTSADPKLAAFKRIAKTEMIALNYITADDVKALLPEIYVPFVKFDQASVLSATSSQGGSSYSGSTYGSSALSSTPSASPTGHLAMTVVITAPKVLLGQIVETIKQFDVAPTQVMIEALIVETTKGSGFDFSASFQDRHAGASNTTGLIAYVGQAAAVLHQVILLAQNNQAKIKASPRVIAQDGREANVKVSVQQYFQMLSGSVGYQYQSLQAIESAIGLCITPRVAHADRKVTCTLTPEVGEVTGVGANALPIITKRAASTTVRVQDGQIIVIGGLLQETNRELRRRIPILADIPLIGSLFESKSTERSEKEITIFVVPHILDEEGNYTGGLVLDRFKDMEKSSAKPTPKPPVPPAVTSTRSASPMPRY